MNSIKNVKSPILSISVIRQLKSSQIPKVTFISLPENNRCTAELFAARKLAKIQILREHICFFYWWVYVNTNRNIKTSVNWIDSQLANSMRYVTANRKKGVIKDRKLQKRILEYVPKEKRLGIFINNHIPHKLYLLILQLFDAGIHKFLRRRHFI